MDKRNIIIAVLSGILLVLVTAGASAYLMRSKPLAETETLTGPKTAEVKPAAKPVVKPVAAAKSIRHKQAAQNIQWNDAPPVQPVQQVQALPPCNDNNIVGTLAGGVGGGLVGSQFGKGNGKTAAAVLGAVGGAALGNNLIPTQNVTCR